MNYDAAVNQYVDATFGSDIKNLVKVKKLYHDILKKKEDLERKVRFLNLLPASVLCNVLVFFTRVACLKLGHPHKCFFYFPICKH